MQKGFHNFKGYPEVYQVWSNPNVKAWTKDANDLATQQAIARERGEDDQIYVQTDLNYFRSLGQIGGVVPPGCDRWGLHATG